MCSCARIETDDFTFWIDFINVAFERRFFGSLEIGGFGEFVVTVKIGHVPIAFGELACQRAIGIEQIQVAITIAFAHAHKTVVFIECERF